MRFLGHAVARATVWAAAVFYRLERVGPELPQGPLIVVTNHPNMLMDPLLALRAAGRRLRVLAKAPLFEIPVFGHVLRSLDALPLYRVQDDPEKVHCNLLAFREAVATLHKGGALLMFPEGKSHTSPALAPLKSGAARIALEAEDRSGWRIGVKIVPLGLVYHRKHRFRSRVVAGVGDAIAVRDWRARYEADRADAARSLTAALACGLERQTLNLSSESDRPLVETADVVYARAKGLAGWRQREALASRLPRLQRFAQQFAWLRAVDPDRWERLARSLRSYRRHLRDLGSGAADVPPRYRAGGIVRYVSREALVLGLALPAAALGTLAWYLAYFADGLVCRLMKPPIETEATVKLLAAIVLYPATWLGWVALAGRLGGAPALLIAALALPPLGFAALHWQRRRAEVWEDARLFLQIVSHPRLRDRLTEQRTALAAELERLDLDWQAELAGRGGAGSPAA